MKALSAVGLALILLTACSSDPGLIASGSPMPDGTPSSGRVASRPRDVSPTPTPSPEPPALGLKVACRLPVQWWDSATSSESHAGFVDFPAGQVVTDSSSPPISNGTDLFYDRAYAKWLFTLRDNVSPDGRRYAYTEGNAISGDATGKIHVVDVATGADRVIYNSPFVPGVVLFAAEGIYFTNDHGEGFREGLWFITPQGGQPVLISSTIFEPIVANGVAWGLAFNAADPHPAPGGITHPYNTILRFDLSTGASVVWWYQPGNDMRLLDGDYSGHLFADTFREDVDGSLSDWMLGSQGTALRIGSANLDHLAAVDANGVWFDDGRSPTLWLFANGRLERIADFNVAAMKIAGGCIPDA